MVRIRNILLALTLVICGIFVGACANTASAAQDWPLKIWKQNTNGKMETFCVVDEDTGVNYVVVGTDEGPYCPAIAITPRLNPDGSLFVS